MAAGAPTCAGEHDDPEACDPVCDPERLAALERTGLGARPDPEFDELAGWARDLLDVPVVLVTLIRADHQVFPGVAGLGPAAPRSSPLGRSLCRQVVTAAEPRSVADTRADPRTWDDPEIPDGVVGYAAAPMTDEDGHVLGTVVAIDRSPRDWTARELAALAGVARAGSGALRLRLARHDAGRAHDRHEDVEERSRLLLAASQAFITTVTVGDVRARITELLTDALGPSYVSVLVADGAGRPRRLPPARSAGAPGERVDPGSDLPSARAIRERRVLHHPDRDAFDREYREPARLLLRGLGLHCVVATPLPADGPLGAIVLGWPVPHAVQPTDLLTIATIAGYAAQALSRAYLLDHRIGVTRAMQNAMLTTLPRDTGLAMAARYAPADSREYVGGDWYDAVPVTDPDRPGDRVLAVSVGDIIGHALPAVTVMGQARSMLRQATWDRPGSPPSVVLDAFEAANAGVALDAAGTALLVHLRRGPAGSWSMTWTNAGHPPPVLIHPDGRTEQLTAHDALFGFHLTEPGQRADQHRDLAPGATLFLYTDGLVERRGSDLDAGLDALTAFLSAHHRRSPDDLVDLAVATLAPNAGDDVVAFAVRVPV